MVKRLLNSLSPKNLALLVLLTLIYFVVEKLGMRLAFVHPLVTPIWLPSGIALAAFILYGYRVWPAIFVGSFLSHATTSVEPSFLIQWELHWKGSLALTWLTSLLTARRLLIRRRAYFCLCWSHAYALP